MMGRIHETGFFRLRIVLLVSWFFVFGCAGGTDVGNPVSSVFTSDQALLTHITEQYARSAQPADLRALTNDASEGWVSGIETAENGYVQTGPGETGPNAADVVQTDGKNLYISAGNAVNIVSVSSIEAMQVIHQIPVPGRVNLLSLHDSRLVILYTPPGAQGSGWRYNDGLKGIDVGLPYWMPVNAKTGILVMDIKNPRVPVFVRRMEVSGNFLSSFRIDDKLYLISQFMPDLPPLVLWHDGTEAERSAAIVVNREVLKSLSINDVLPGCVIYDEEGGVTQTGRLISTEKVISPAASEGGTLVSVVTIPLSDVSGAFSAMGVVADIHYVHASQNAVYLLSTLYHSDAYRTRIYELDIAGTTISYAGEGTVDGHILDPYSVNADSDVLRIATTSGGVSGSPETNSVYCLQNTGGKLALIGRANVALGERLQWARFFGGKGFLASAEATAPLRTVDLADPEHPAVVGELPGPGGHNAFLFPLPDDSLLVMGKNAPDVTDAMDGGGIRLSVYDTRDIAASRLLSTQQIGDGGTDSEVFYHYKAFTFRAEERLLAFPVSLFERSAPSEAFGEESGNTFNGLYVYRLTVHNGLEFKGRMAISSPSAGAEGVRGWIRGIFLHPDIYAASSETVSASAVETMAGTPFSLSLIPGLPTAAPSRDRLLGGGACK